MKILDALEFAAQAHKGQMRKYPKDMPYISHPAAVGLVLARAGFGEDVVVAGILHDVIEDTPFTAKDIEERFGADIAVKVLGVTEDGSLPWDERKKAYNEHLKTVDEEVLAISAADLLANRTAQMHALRQGVNVWKYFSKNPRQYMEKISAVDAERIAIIKSKLKHQLVDELVRVERETRELAGKIEM